MTLFATSIVFGCVLLYYGGNFLLHGAVSVGKSIGWSQSIIGLVLVSLGTSAPELFVSVGAAIQGLGDMAVGNVVGSNIVNIAIVLGVGAIAMPLVVDRTIRSHQIPVLILLTIASCLMLMDGKFTRLEGAALLLATMGGIGWTLLTHYASATPDQKQDRQPLPLLSILQAVGGIVLLVVGANTLIWGGVGIATTLGVSQAVVGLTVTAIGTSLPEIAATLVAVFRREPDLAVGNVVGSNILNLGLVLGFTGLVSPLNSGEVGMIPLIVMLLLTMLVGIVAWRPGHFSRWTGAGLLACYAGYFLVLLR